MTAPGTKRLKLKYDELLSSFACNFNLRRYITETEYQNMDHAQELGMVRKEVELFEEGVRVKSCQIEELQDEVRDHLQVKANNAALTADNEAQRQMRQEAVLATERAEVGRRRLTPA